LFVYFLSIVNQLVGEKTPSIVTFIYFVLVVNGIIGHDVF